ncbi:mannose-1-phosphate guanylyltransferase/mannose-6-phosphate isomerase [Janthinobacterium sp. FT14W]|uniref:mannose-1-phosphate guanylyltransferase/mannose-6-phosphate isomerase n=1 Tax=Janthinobacterium sp. FT14W TaxID=2654253 RepID=UPI0012653395|nr:mannose-1-phosphate guanylyltransferase/mannose-6-phosphate isomerase [Janthinobacterium sp. FT14W]KAB8062356.1 mannose-1-phosphate guanylyltransferase/mannose-6-phosphate isomerase [Janthinobacterium sp. FT14W]
MNTPLVPVILCGGFGTRLWPLSREAFPKQFLRLSGQDSMLQQTLQRLAGIDDVAPALLVCNESSRFIVAEQLREIGLEESRMLLEPMRRNTAPAIATAALQAMANGDDPILLVQPADHVILDTPAFHRAIALARTAAEEDNLLTFGITPTGPETGYGYIRAEGDASEQVRRVIEFVEKPALALAEQYVASGDYLWNSGIFLFRASHYLAELERYQPAVLAACRAAFANAKSDHDFIRLDSDAYAASPDIAVDYAVMERTDLAATVALDAGWNDIGSWAAVFDVADKDTNNNSAQGDVLMQDCNDCLIHGNSRLVTAIGMRNTVIVETADAVLVMDAAQAQYTKTMVAQLIARERPEATMHREVFRPWGSYDSIGNGERFQVKRITVKPGSKLSLQMHHHRAEHWIVVSGTAEITNGDKTYLLTENQSTYIPLGVVHSLANPGKVPLELIEIQSGSYLGEDDIVRFEDRYGRV